jgi:uncharacterized protein
MNLGSLKHPRVNPRFSHFQLRVGRSPIHRFGVFAREDIPSRQKVVEYTGQRITQCEARERFEQVWRSRKRNKRIYLFHVSTRWVIDGAVGGSGAELINHSCDPNLRSRRIRGHILYFSRRKIARGEELTVDYRFPKKSPRVVCRCGSHFCRGTINRR